MVNSKLPKHDLERSLPIDHDVAGTVVRRTHLDALAPFILEMSIDADRLLEASTLDPRRYPGRQSLAHVQRLPGEGWAVLRVALDQVGAASLAERFGRRSCRLASLRSWVLEMELPYAVEQTAHVHTESTFGSVCWLQFPTGLDGAEAGATFLPVDATRADRPTSLAGAVFDLLVFPGWLPHFPASAPATDGGPRVVVASDLLFTDPSGQPIFVDPP